MAALVTLRHVVASCQKKKRWRNMHVDDATRGGIASNHNKHLRRSNIIGCRSRRRQHC